MENNKTDRVNNEVCDCLIRWGIYWPDDADLYSIGIDVITGLLHEGKIKGLTYIEVMSSEFGIPVYKINNKLCEDVICEVIPINNSELENIKNSYISKINDNNLNEYDNIVCIIEDDPRYSYSENDYITTTVVFSSKSNSFIINIGCPIAKKMDISSEQLMKKLTLFKR